MYRWNKNIPDGTRDIIYDEVLLYKDIEQKFSDIYNKNGFKQIITPAIEYYDVFDYDSQFITQENMYKLTDNNGRLIVLRADNTTPIARVIATKLKNSEFPQKLFYNQNIYRVNSDYSGKRNEILQSGVELIGASGIKSDLFCITTAIETLQSLNIKFKIEIGHVGFYNALIKELNLNESENELIRKYVDSKNAVSLNILNKISSFDKIKKIPLLYGDFEVFEKAKILANGNTEALETLDYVYKLYKILVDAGYGEYIMVDLGIVHKIDYYTGVVFRAYIENAGEPVLKGGRYDNLIKNFDYNIPATGFAVNVCLVADTIARYYKLPAYETPKYIIHFDTDLYIKAENYKLKLDEKGVKNEYSCFDEIEDTIKYAKYHHIKCIAVISHNETKIIEV